MPTADVGARDLLRRVGFPHPPYAGRLLRTGFLVWLALRSFLGFGLFLTNGHGFAPAHWRAAILLAVVPALVTLVDVRVMREGVFYRNLAGSPAWLLGLPLLGAAIPEVLLDGMLRALCGCG